MASSPVAGRRGRSSPFSGLARPSSRGRPIVDGAGDFEQAVASLDCALQTAGEDATEWKAEVLAARAKAKRQLGDLAGALDDYRQAAELMPTDADYPYGAATILVKMGNQDAVEILFGKAIELDPDSVDAFLARSELYIATGHTALAIADVKSAWKVAGDDITRKAVEVQLIEHAVRMSTDGLWLPSLSQPIQQQMAY